MLKELRTLVLAPLLRRLGTAAAAYLVAQYGVDGEAAQQIVTGLSVALLVAVDLVASNMAKKG